jgi:hypothetical protein
VRRGDLFARSVTEKLLAYSLGRGLEYGDMPMLRAIARDAEAEDYRFSALVMGVVRSPLFTMNQKATVAMSQE